MINFVVILAKSASDGKTLRREITKNIGFPDRLTEIDLSHSHRPRHPLREPGSSSAGTVGRGTWTTGSADRRADRSEIEVGRDGRSPTYLSIHRTYNDLDV
jgi:hypothetical protein